MTSHRNDHINQLDILTLMLSTQTNPDKDSVIIISCKDVIPVSPPQIHPDIVPLRQFDYTADTSHLATLVWEGGVIQRHHFLSILVYGTLSTPIHRCVQGEVVESVHRAGEDACVRAVAVSLIEHHVGKYQDS